MYRVMIGSQLVLFDDENLDDMVEDTLFAEVNKNN